MWWCFGRHALAVIREDDDFELDAIAVAVADAVADADADAVAVAFVDSSSGSRDARADGRPDTTSPDARGYTVRDPAGRRRRRRRGQLRCAERR